MLIKDTVEFFIQILHLNIMFGCHMVYLYLDLLGSFLQEFLAFLHGDLLYGLLYFECLRKTTHKVNTCSDKSHRKLGISHTYFFCFCSTCSIFIRLRQSVDGLCFVEMVVSRYWRNSISYSACLCLSCCISMTAFC